MSEACKKLRSQRRIRAIRATIKVSEDERSWSINCAATDPPKCYGQTSHAELTVSELEELIKRTVKNSVAEVMIEFAMEADVEAQMVYEAEINDMLRHEMQSYGTLLASAPVPTTKLGRLGGLRPRISPE